jgi:hypothetical protein
MTRAGKRTGKAKQDWTTNAGPRGPKPRAPLATMAVGDVWHVETPTPEDSKRLARNTSQHGIRHGKGFSCRMDRTTRITAVTRLR